MSSGSVSRTGAGGVFISFEGGEGAGKSTQIVRLGGRIGALGRKVVVTREPGGTVLGAAVRELLVKEREDPPVPIAELFLYAADRAQHVSTILRPALAAGQVVLCDRYADATEAYQGWGRSLPEDLIRRTNDLATSGLWPDRTVVLDLDPAVGVRRALDREGPHGGPGEARFEGEALAFHEKVRAGYRAIAGREPARLRIVDAGGTPEEVDNRVWEAVKDLFVTCGA